MDEEVKTPPIDGNEPPDVQSKPAEPASAKAEPSKPVSDEQSGQTAESAAENEKKSEEPDGKGKKKDKKDAKKLNEQLEAMTAERDSLKAKLDEARDAHLRTLAEYDNYRKRTARERDEIYPAATANAVTQFLPAIDAFERGMQIQCGDEKFYKGMSMVQAQMNAALEKLGCVAFGAAGDVFDPNLHNAIMRDDDGDDATEPTITEVFQPGYKIGEKVVRFAMVKVKG